MSTAEASLTATSSLFSPSLLSSLVTGSSSSAPLSSSASSSLSSFSLPPGYSIRPLQPLDYHNGLLDVLRVLTTVGDITEEAFNARLEYMRGVNALGAMTHLFPGGAGQDSEPDRNSSQEEGGTYFILVITDDRQKVVGTGAVIVERKFIHQLGLVGHIEDIAVAKDQQGKKLGLRIIQALDHVAAKVGCYKTILDCSEANEGFYVKCGYKRAGLEMAHYYNK